MNTVSLDHLTPRLDIEVAQHSTAGVKSCNEDAIGIRVPSGNALLTKGAVAVIADGVSSAESGKEASETAVVSFLSDYYSTHDTWSVQTSGLKVLKGLNIWLYGQGQKYLNPEKGYITTFSTLILKSGSGYIFHVGDSRIYRLRNGELEQITRDHTTAVSGSQRFLSRALGLDTNLEVDFHHLELQEGDCFLLTTDGVHDWLNHKELQRLASSGNSCEHICQTLVQTALDHGSDDNLSVQLIKVNTLGNPQREDVLSKLNSLPLPPPLHPGTIIDGWKVVREIQATSRSEVYLVEHRQDNTLAVMKTPSPNFEDDAAYLERFVLEEWIGSRIQSSHVASVIRQDRPRKFLYYLTEYVQGPTLAQLIRERTRLPVVDARNIIIQVASGIRAFHRKDSLHQDIKPDNIIYTNEGVKIIDFGSAYIAGIDEIETDIERQSLLGTLDYCAPEYRLHATASPRSDQFSLALLLYEMLTGKHPYEAYRRASTPSDFQRLVYTPCTRHNPLVPTWMDAAIQRALSIDPDRRYPALSEFIQDLKQPNPTYSEQRTLPLIDRNPIRFWQILSAIFFAANLVLLFLLLSNR